MYKTAAPDRYGLLKAYARENRKNATLAESVLWEQLRSMQKKESNKSKTILETNETV